MGDVTINGRPLKFGPRGSGSSLIKAQRRREWLRRSCARQDWLCHYCGIEMEQPGLHLAASHALREILGPRCATNDHLIPLSKGGEDVEENTVACCSRCNNEKGDMDPWDFVELVEQRKAGEVEEVVVAHVSPLL